MKKYKYLCCVLLFLFCGLCFSCRKMNHQVEEETLDTEVIRTEETWQTEENTGPVYVYVCGAVADPGVYELEQNARVTDAIAAAGGMTTSAAAFFINQAELVSDGQKLYVPTVEEAEQLPEPGADIRNSSAGTGSDGKININTAGKEQLMQLPGVGESKAGSIISYREQSGSFGKIEDIKNVNGIGESTYEKLKDSICI